MDAVGFLYVSLGSSTVQLHGRLVRNAHAHVQRLVSVVRMATVLEECATEEKLSGMRFLWAKGLHEKDIHKEMFCLRCEVFVA
jgi:hypothetical protein